MKTITINDNDQLVYCGYCKSPVDEKEQEKLVDMSYVHENCQQSVASYQKHRLTSVLAEQDIIFVHDLETMLDELLPFIDNNSTKDSFNSFFDPTPFLATTGFQIRDRRIVYLNLTNKSLRNLPESIKLLSEMQTLDLANNELDNLPKGISKLVSLRSLNVANNTLTKLPSALGNLPNLKFLDITHNQLTLTRVLAQKLKKQHCIVVSSPMSPNLTNLLPTIRGFNQIEGPFLGYAAISSQQYPLCKLLFQHAETGQITKDDILRLQFDFNPIVRIIGLCCFARTTSTKKARKKWLQHFFDDPTVILTQFGCIVSRITIGIVAKLLVNKPKDFL